MEGKPKRIISYVDGRRLVHLMDPEERREAIRQAAASPKSFEEVRRGILAGTASDLESSKLEAKSSPSTELS